MRISKIKECECATTIIFSAPFIILYLCERVPNESAQVAESIGSHTQKKVMKSTQEQENT
jgi:hypothetical protein